MANSLTMYALDVAGNVIATKEAENGFRLTGIRKFYKEVNDAHAVYICNVGNDGWLVAHHAYNSWYTQDELLPKPFQMYLMLLGE